MAAQISSFGGYPRLAQSGVSCHWRSQLVEIVRETTARHGETLAYGRGRSYGDSCLAAGGVAVQVAGLDRFISADWVNGRLVVEAGVTLGEILRAAIPHGWFLPVTPGTQFVTVGGAVANDVHGKNHHVRGTFGRHLVRFGLARSDRGEMTCSSHEDPALFAATIGGLGLTGVITWAELALAPIRSSLIDTSTVRFAGLGDFFALSEELDAQHEYAVAWIDCTARGRKAGQGVYFVGDHAGEGPLAVEPVSARSIPLRPPVSLVNPLSVRLFNRYYLGAQPAEPARGRAGYQPFFYPLDGVLHWNRIYGRGGFQQFQCVLPSAVAEPALRELLQVIARSGEGSFLVVLKRCGDLVSPGLLSFPMPGVSLAIDFAQSGRLDRLLPRLDAIVREAQGRLYPAKDAHMSGEDFRNAYPRWTEVERLRDPALKSHFWQRVTA